MVLLDGVADSLYNKSKVFNCGMLLLVVGTVVDNEFSQNLEVAQGCIPIKELFP